MENKYKKVVVPRAGGQEDLIQIIFMTRSQCHEQELGRRRRRRRS
jgi:hypothetical protein